MAALRQVIEAKGRFCALYGDRASHFFLTPKAGEPGDPSRLTKERDVDPQIRAEQMGHTVDVNENVYAITSLKRRKDAVNALERAIGA